jgi:hypothetical protein
MKSKFVAQSDLDNGAFSLSWKRAKISEFDAKSSYN